MFVKCPRCELNYMEDSDKVCKVCFREIHGKEPVEEQELCTICNEASVMHGKEFCQVCYREMNDETADPLVGIQDNEDEPLLTGEVTVSTMDEIAQDLNSKDIPEHEFQQIDKDLSLEELEEQEESDSSLDDDQDRD